MTPTDVPRETRTGDRPCYRLLIVDDDDVIREGLVGYLENYHESSAYTLTLDSAEDAQAARAKLAEAAYDLVISDINMPGEDGFSFLGFVRQAYPRTRTALITAYKVADYIRNAKRTGTFNIIAKTAPFNFEELSTVVNNLLDPDSAFGLRHYLDTGTEVHCQAIENSEQIMEIFGLLNAFLKTHDVPNANDILTAVIEAITNAVYHVAKNPDGSLKYQKGQSIEALSPDEYVYFYYGKDADKLGIAIVDQGGRITADEVIYWLERNMTGSNLMDTHGRGVYLMHSLADRVLVNIDPGKTTEIIMLSYLNKDFRSNKPIYINQINA